MRDSSTSEGDLAYDDYPAADRWVEEEGLLWSVDRLCDGRFRLSVDSLDCRSVVSRAGETQDGRGSWCRVREC